MSPTSGTVPTAAARSPARTVRCGLVALLAVILSFLQAWPAAGEPSSVRAALGWDGWVRFGTWNPLTVEAGVDRPVRGWLVVDIPQEFGAQRVRLRYSVDLPEGGRAIWRVPVLVVDARRPVRVAVVAEDGAEVASAEVLPQAESAVASVVGYLGQNPPSPPPEASSGGRRVVARLREEVLPETAAAYASLDLLVVEDLDERRLNDAQRHALQAWVLHGGRVVTSGWLAAGAPLSGWLSAAQHTGRVVELSGLGSVAAGPLRELHPLPGGRPVVERSYVVAVWAPRGLGRVYAWAADPQQVPAGSPLWYLALPPTTSREGPPEPDVRPRAPVGPAAVGLGAFAVLWLVSLAVAARTPWGWLLALVVLSAGTVGMPTVAREVRERSTTLDVTWVEVLVDRARRAYAWGYAQAPYRGVYTYTLPRAVAVAASGGFSEAEVSFLDDRVVVRARQGAGERLRLYWEVEGAAGAVPAVQPREGSVVFRGPGTSHGVVFWGRRQAPLEKSQEPDEWVALRWERADPQHPALVSLRWVYPAAATIVEDRPVVALPLADGRRGWLVVGGQLP